MTLREIGAGPVAERLRKREEQHKYHHGHALVVSGPPGHGGAARLAARAALRVGAGLVTLGCPRAAVAEHAARLDAIMVRALDAAEDLDRLLEDRRFSALCLGPGLGFEPVRAELVAAALASGRPLVLDADALTLVSRDAILFDRLHPACVLTPHAGEFARLFPDLAAAEELTARVDACHAAAGRAGCTVLLKGAETVIASPGEVAVNRATGARAAPWLATAGAGDVLAGLIAGLLARGLTPFEAAETGAWLHVEAARAFGPGLIAEDLPEALPGVFRALGL
ncbi:NAD(P)H-hydrate dehydratase [Rhodobacter sp. CZR27]|uniref:NAD(P)H-hydrate dehydratase n=1 Tax=Rhodobacter sp. CZR27 TaxID=2033869 RepID=UPI000BBF1439